MGKHILLVDDSTTFRQVTRLALQRAGYETTEAVDGLAGLKEAEKRRFDLIISDINMPNMNGLEFLKAVKQRPNAKFTPVLMLTTESAAGKMADAKASGAKAWLTKPFQPQMLIDTVATLVRA